jgi:uncharacterized protein
MEIPKIPVLQGEWRKLAFANYVVDREVLEPLVPHKTELDEWDGKCYMSLLGFMFKDTKVMGLKVPGHVDFEEVNFRFYAKTQGAEGWKHGIVFVNQLVRKPLIGASANATYLEHYKVMPMKYNWHHGNGEWRVSYSFKKEEEDNWSFINLNAEDRPLPMTEGSKEEFLNMRLFAYNRITEQQTMEFGVEHPKWELYPVKDFQLDVDFGKVFGERWAFMNGMEPESVYLAEGAPVKIFNWTLL